MWHRISGGRWWAKKPQQGSQMPPQHLSYPFPSTPSQPSWSHQLALTELHLRLAAELQRPTSLHCVQGYGHLMDMIRRLGPGACPPKIMIHRWGREEGLIDEGVGIEVAGRGAVGQVNVFLFICICMCMCMYGRRVNARKVSRAG